MRQEREREIERERERFLYALLEISTKRWIGYPLLGFCNHWYSCDPFQLYTYLYPVNSIIRFLYFLSLYFRMMDKVRGRRLVQFTRIAGNWTATYLIIYAFSYIWLSFSPFRAHALVWIPGIHLIIRCAYRRNVTDPFLAPLLYRIWRFSPNNILVRFKHDARKGQRSHLFANYHASFRLAKRGRFASAS